MRILGVVLWAATLPALAGADKDTGKISQISTGSAADQQNSPAISSTNVVWTDDASVGGASNFDIYFYDLSTGGAAVNLTNTPGDQEFLEDIDGSNVVWTHTSASVAGDIVVYDLVGKRASTVASSTSGIFFEQPSIRGRYIAFLQSTATQVDVDLYDNDTGDPITVTNDAAVQGRPRVGADYVVYEDYNSGNADVFGWQISTSGPPFAIATGADSQMTPDIDGNTVVYIDTIAGHDQLFSYDLTTKATKQLTSVASSKVLPRISGNRIVWSDDRNGNLDLYLYDLSTASELPLVTGAGDQFLSDIDGDRVVYTDNSAGFEQVYLFTFDAPPPPPPSLPPGCDPTKTNAVGASVSMTKSGWRPSYAWGEFAPQANKTYWVCVDNGMPDGSQRTTQFLFSVGWDMLLTPSDFRPAANPPRHVATQLPTPTAGHHHNQYCHHHDERGGHDDDDDHDSSTGPYYWSAGAVRTAPA